MSNVIIYFSKFFDKQGYNFQEYTIRVDHIIILKHFLVVVVVVVVRIDCSD